MTGKDNVSDEVIPEVILDSTPSELVTTKRKLGIKFLLFVALKHLKFCVGKQLQLR